MGYQFSEWSKQFCETANEDVVLLAQETIGILQRNMNGRFNFLIKLTRANGPVEVLGLQTTYWRNQFVASKGQIEELVSLSAKTVADLARGSLLLCNLFQENMMAQNQPFEFPEQLRQLVEENVERARQFYLQFMDGVTQAMGAWSAPSSNWMGDGFNVIRDRAVKLAKENAEAAFTVAGEVAKAQNLQELVTIQTRYAQKQMKLYALQAQELGRLMSEAMQTNDPGNTVNAESQDSSSWGLKVPKSSPGDQT